jgi:energy-converting hydrogenase Eha subunit E
MDGLRRLVLLGQGGYYLITGLWPLVSLSTFEAATGPKTDDWLVRTVALLIVAIAVSILVGVWRSHPSRETLILAILSAVALAGVDVVYVLMRVISPIYLLDAVVEGLILIALAATSRRPGRPPSVQPHP